MSNDRSPSGAPVPTDQTTASAVPRPPALSQKIPYGPLLVTLAVQIVATTAAYSVPAVAPEVARDLGIQPALVGLYLSIVYGVGILSALFSPALVYTQGAVRISQAVLLATLLMVATAAVGSLATVTLSAALMGLAYGATAPASTHLLVPRTPPARMNLILSLRQVGVPAAGTIAGLLMPRMSIAWGWQTALALQIIPVLLLAVVLEYVRPGWDKREAPRTGAATSKSHPLGLLRGNGSLCRLSFASFVYSGLQGCFVAFMTTHLTSAAHIDLIRAGEVLALYQVSGAISRPIWGWLADRVLAARWLLALQGLIMCGAAIFAAQFSPEWTLPGIYGVSIVAGATASGFTGIAFAEYARLGGSRRTETTGLGAASMFAGVMVLPASMSAAVIQLGGFEAAYMAIAALALLAGAALTIGRDKLLA